MGSLLIDRLIALWDAWAPVTTEANTYVDVGTWNTQQLKTKHIAVTATDNDLLAKILGSLDGGVTYPLEVEAEYAVTADATVAKTITAWYSHLKLQVKPAVDDTHGTLTGQYGGSSL